MAKRKTISGFSKLNKRGKIKWIVENFFKDPEVVMRELMSYWLKNEEQQKILDGFSENTISVFPMPFSVAPNFVINGKDYCVPMVIEESSVVAAASSAAKYWMNRGGFNARVIDVIKLGQLHFNFNGKADRIQLILTKYESYFRKKLKPYTENMEARGGGILQFQLRTFEEEPGYFQVMVSFNTCDSMGANFINTILEELAILLESKIAEEFDGLYNYRTIMCILSNYTPDCLVEASVSCPVTDLGPLAGGIKPEEFADKFAQAIRIAEIDPYRATTHNKGIFNGIDSVVIATGNDFRAIESGGHTYAAKDGQYRSLSHCEVKDGVFKF